MLYSSKTVGLLESGLANLQLNLYTTPLSFLSTLCGREKQGFPDIHCEKKRYQIPSIATGAPQRRGEVPETFGVFLTVMWDTFSHDIGAIL